MGRPLILYWNVNPVGCLPRYTKKLFSSRNANGLLLYRSSASCDDASTWSMVPTMSGANVSTRGTQTSKIMYTRMMPFSMPRARPRVPSMKPVNPPPMEWVYMCNKIDIISLMPMNRMMKATMDRIIS